VESPDDLLTGLDEDQARAVSVLQPSVCVLAAAGSGKTRVLTRRVAHRIATGTAQPQHTLVLTFTRKAAGELRDRLRALDVEASVTAGTFHAVAYAQLRQRWIDKGRAVPMVTTRPLRILETALSSLRLSRSINVRSLAAEISWAKSQCLTVEDYEVGVQRLKHRSPIAVPQFVRVYEAYESEKRKRRTLDYDDLLLLMIQALEQDRTFATSQRWMFRHFFVDEFQDVNRAQFELLRLWCGGRDDVFVVGDVNQAIYGWNGADSSYLEHIDRAFPAIERVQLRTNYRSSGSVLRAARGVLPAAEIRSDETFSGPDVAPRVLRCNDESDEARTIARELRSAHSRGVRWGDMAVLVRTNVQRAPIESTLDRLGIPFQTSGGAGWLHQSIVQSALDYLRESPRVPLARRAPDLEEMARDGANELDALVAAAKEAVANDPDLLVADFLSWLEVASRNDGASDGSGVTVVTFHRAKGLEWPFVVLAGIEEGIVPLDNQPVDEEQRLFYVAVTRARSELLCTWAATRTNRRGTTVEQRPGQWLTAVEQAGLADAVAPVAVVIDHIDTTRSKLDMAHEVDPVHDALLRWRAARAKLTGVEAELILSSDVLSAIARERPQSIEALVECGLGQVRAASIGDELLLRTATN
jgi:DNA helicase II / ATP-dependent DNA helicase PcrA